MANKNTKKMKNIMRDRKIINIRTDKAVRKYENDLNRKVTAAEYKEIRYSILMDYKKHKNKLTIQKAIAAVGLVGLIGAGTIAGVKTITAGQNNRGTQVETTKEPTEEKSFIETIKVSETPTVTPEEEKENVIQEILKEYNEKYETELTEDTIGYIESTPQFYIENENGNYIFDYRATATPETKIVEDPTTKLYTIVNNEDKIIASIGDVNNEIVNVDTKQVMIEDKEYTESDKKIDLTRDKEGNLKSKEEIKKIYDSIEEAHEREANEPEIAD